MGNKIGADSEFEQKNWRKLTQNSVKTILFNEMTNKSVEKHVAAIQNQEKDPLEICQWRQNLPSDSCVVQLYEYGFKNKNFCNSQPQLYVICERVFGLKEIITFSKIQSFILIRDIACAMQYLIYKFGYFSPQPSMIGVNADGRGRMWINENSASIIPEEDELKVPESQLILLNNLIRLLTVKSSNEPDFPAEYPFNLDFKSAVFYIDQVLKSSGSYHVERVYLDRSEYHRQVKRLNELREKQQHSRVALEENSRKILELQVLHENLRRQQQLLLQKQKMMEIALKNKAQVKSGMSVYDQPTQLTRINPNLSFKYQHENISKPPNQNTTKLLNQNMPMNYNPSSSNEALNNWQQMKQPPYESPSQMTLNPSQNLQFRNTQASNNNMNNAGARRQEVRQSLPVHRENHLVAQSAQQQVGNPNIEFVDSMLVVGESNIAERNARFELRMMPVISENN